MMVVAVLRPGPTADVYYAILALWLVSIIVERAIIASAGRRSASVRSDRGSALFIVISIFFSIAIANAFAQSGIALLPVDAFYVGNFLMVAGIAVRIWAVATLRGFFSYTVQIKKDHHVVESGPYGYVRHPAYAGSLLTILGIGFALQSWGAVLVMALIFGVAFGYRIMVEERTLVGSLGEEYVTYSRRVRQRLIPFVF